MRSITRRDFAKAAAAIGITTAAAGAASGQTTKARATKPVTTTTTSPADRIGLGFIGLGNRGDRVLDGFLAHPDAHVVALCDIHRPYLDFAAKKVGGGGGGGGGGGPAQFTDYRRPTRPGITSG
jgi:hypothetical protein